MHQGFFVPGPSCHSSQLFLGGIGKKDVEVCGSIQFEYVLKFIDIQVCPVEKEKHFFPKGDTKATKHWRSAAIQAKVL